MDEKRTTIHNLNNGAIIDLFDEEWRKVLENIADPSTDQTAERSIEIRSRFLTNEGLVSLINFLSRIDKTSKIELLDDGISQQVNVQKGISGALKGKEIVSSIVTLRPYRTFTEVEQPESDFLFRISEKNNEISCALFESDGGKWKQQARENIKHFLQAKLTLSGITIIA